MDNALRASGFWMQHFLLLTYILMVSGTKRSGVRLTNESGIITSPGYPNGYPNSIAFIWLINTTLTKYIELTFLDFDLEPYTDCTADYVKIRNKKATRWSFKDVPQIDLTTKEPTIKISSKGPYCNKNRPPKVVTSSSNLMAIVFIADSSKSYRGFKATYRSLERKPCNFVSTAGRGTIMTPGYPLRYPNEGECFWTISIQRGKFIRLEFIEFDLEFNTQFCMDEIYVYDGESSSAPILARGCRSNPRIVYSSTNNLRIKFTSQGYHRNKGFKAVYTTSSSKGCGGDFDFPNGTFTSPSFNLLASYTYPSYSDCLWTVKAPNGHVISLKFTFFDVLPGASGRCNEDYVDVYDGFENAANRIGRYCNADKPGVVTSSGKELQMRFTSNHKSHGKGFRVTYQRHSTACDQPLGMEDGRITDHRISASSYLRQSLKYKQSNARLNGVTAWCSQIQVNSRVGEYLQIDFRHLTKVTGFATQGYMIDGQQYYVTRYKIEYSNTEGRFFTTYVSPDSDKSKNEYTTFLGNKDSTGLQRNNLLQPIVAKMFRIFPIGYVHGRKRVICLRAEIYGCKFNFGDGKLLQNPDDNIIYNGVASTKTSSHWVISPSNIYRNAAFYVMPLFFNIDCAKSALLLSDGVRNKSYCGKNRPPPFQVFSARRQLFVSLEAKGDQNLQHQGFGLQYFKENLGSGRILRSRRGVVRSARHVAERVSNRTASTWIIIQPNRQRLVARFTTLKLGKRRDGKCDEYVEIKDGLFDTSPSYGNFCIGIPPKPLVSSGNYLKVVLHSRSNALRFKREMRHSRIIFEIAYTTLDSSSRPTERRVTLKAEEPSQTVSTASKGHCEGKLNTYLALIILLVTLRSLFFPR